MLLRSLCFVLLFEYIYVFLEGRDELVTVNNGYKRYSRMKNVNKQHPIINEPEKAESKGLCGQKGQELGKEEETITEKIA